MSSELQSEGRLLPRLDQGQARRRQTLEILFGSIFAAVGSQTSQSLAYAAATCRVLAQDLDADALELDKPPAA